MSGAARLFTIMPASVLYFASGSFPARFSTLNVAIETLSGPAATADSRTETPLEPMTGCARSWIRYSPNAQSMIPTCAPGKVPPTFTAGIAGVVPTLNHSSSITIRSGFRSPGLITRPPRGVIDVAFAPLSPTTKISPKFVKVKLVATRSFIWTSIPSRLS